MNNSSDMSCNNGVDEELMANIQRISRGLDNLRSVASAGAENSLHHLLGIPELSEFEGPDEGEIEYIESFISDPEEQRCLSEENDDCLDDTEDENHLTELQSLSLIDNAQASSSDIMILPSNDESVMKSKNSFFSNLFGSKKESTSSASARESADTIKNSYFSRLFNRKKPEAESPISNYSIPSCNSQNDAPEVDESHLKIAEQLIEETEAQAPAGTPHLSSLARTINRPILAFSSSMSLRHHAGKEMDGPAVMIQFHSARPGMATGHWTLLGNHDPEGIPMSLNNCLFNVVCAQTGRKPSVLRRETIKEMRKHIKSLARRIQAMVAQEECQGLVILIGGASYSGTSASDARRIIDNSQGGRCHPGHQQGHPRGHASHPGASGGTESAENYSRGGWKTGFLSRNDQDVVGHMALRTSAAQRAMEALNRGSENQAVRLNPSELNGSVPEGAEFRDGNIESPRPIRQLVLVLRHHAGHANDPDYPVFVHTFYPVVT